MTSLEDGFGLFKQVLKGEDGLAIKLRIAAKTASLPIVQTESKTMFRGRQFEITVVLNGKYFFIPIFHTYVFLALMSKQRRIQS